MFNESYKEEAEESVKEEAATVTVSGKAEKEFWELMRFYLLILTIHF